MCVNMSSQYIYGIGLSAGLFNRWRMEPDMAPSQNVFGPSQSCQN